MRNLVVIGGSDAGVSAALRALEMNPGRQVTLVAADGFPNFSVCGLPFFISGETPRWQDLAHRRAAELEERGITLLLDHRAMELDPEGGRVRLRDPEGAEAWVGYDRLVLATGARPLAPALEGIPSAGVFTLRTMGDGLALKDYLNRYRPARAAIVGTGYIGLEMTEALTRLGLEVTLVSRSGVVLRSVDADLSDMVAGRLAMAGVEVAAGVEPRAVEAGPKGPVLLGDGLRLETGLVLLATGVAPDSSLAAPAGAEVGLKGAIRVSRAMETSLPGIWAAGDCVETWHRLLGRPVYLPLGSTAHKQGRAAGENAAGGRAVYAGSLGTQVVKVMDLVVARTGLSQAEAQNEPGLTPHSSSGEYWDHKAYYPGATPMTIRLTADRWSGRLLGAQMVGRAGAEVSKRLDILAAALHQGLAVEELLDLDLSYTPPLSSPWDPVQMAALGWLEEVRREQGFSPAR